MIGCNKGLGSLIKKKTRLPLQPQHFLHREALMSRTLREDLREVLDQIARMVNFIKTRSVKSHLFEQICTNMESQHR